MLTCVFCTGDFVAHQRLNRLRSCLQAYALKRLVAGLDSGRKAARQGFALALTQMLEQTNAASPEQVVEAIEASIDVSNSRKVHILTSACWGVCLDVQDAYAVQAVQCLTSTTCDLW